MYKEKDDNVHYDKIKQLAKELELEHSGIDYKYVFRSNYDGVTVEHVIDLSATHPSLWAIAYEISRATYQYGRAKRLAEIHDVLGLS